MKIEKLTENKIRVVFKLEELSDKNMNLYDFMADNSKSKNFFVDILNRAEKEVGFFTKDCKLLIEAFSSLDDVFVFTITKYVVDNKKRKLVKISKKQTALSLDSPIYCFSSFEEFCDLCSFLNKSKLPLTNIAKQISLYIYNDTYYLIFSKLNLTYKYLRTLLSYLSEFATVLKNSKGFDAKLFEHGKVLIRKNAFLTGIRYFS